MDVKTTFLTSYLHEDIYVAQTKGFEDQQFPYYVYKLKKALFGLKQPCYERCNSYIDACPRSSCYKRAYYIYYSLTVGNGQDDYIDVEEVNG